MILRKELYLSFIIFVFFTGSLIPKFHPEINWKEISSGKFTVIYPVEYRDVANYAIITARELYSEIKTFWGSDVRGNIRILLHDSTDISDEDSTFFPYNQIKMSIYPSEPYLLFGDYTDHIRDVLRHGLNRIFVYNQGSRVLRFFRKYFGINPVFFPTLYIPGWTLAGVSAFEEINSNEDTRFRNPEFDLILKKIAFNGGLPALGSLKSNLSQWPGPLSPNIFGTGLVKFISNDVRKDKIREFVKHYTSHPFPMEFDGFFKPKFITLSNRFKTVFGKSIEEIWEKLENKIRNNGEKLSYSKMVTKSGFIKRFPVFLSGDDIMFFSENYRTYPGVYKLSKSGGKPSLLFRKKVVKSLSNFKEGRIVYFSAVDTYKRFYYFSDIYSYDLEDKKVRRLTRGARITDPVRVGERIYCLKRENAVSYLAVVDPSGGNERIISKKFNFLSGLSISPNGKHIAVAVKLKNQKWKIGIFNDEGSLVRLIGNKGKRSFSPKWKNNEELMFISSDGDDFSINSYDRESESFLIYRDEKISGVKYFDILNSDELLVSTLTPDGYDLAIIDISKVTSEVFQYGIVENKKVEVKIDSKESLGERGYNALRELSPKYFTLTFRDGGNEIQSGIVASGFDSLLKHYFKVKYLVGNLSGTSNYYFEYVFNGFPFEFNFKYTDFTDSNRSDERGDFFSNARKLTLALNIPVAVSLKGTFSLYTDIHFEKMVDDYENDYIDEYTKYNGVRIGFNFNSTEVYYNSISENDGINLMAVYSKETEWLGSPYSSSVFTLKYSQFIRIYGLNLLALRFSFAESFGEGKREFYMGGVSGGDETGYSGEKIFGLLRGFSSGSFRGTGGFSLNLEYRMLLFKIERAFSIFRSIESLYATFFLDAGQVWEKNPEFDPACSYGGELNLIFYLGKYKYILTGGIGIGIRPEKTSSLYFRLGTSF